MPVEPTVDHIVPKSARVDVHEPEHGTGREQDDGELDGRDAFLQRRLADDNRRSEQRAVDRAGRVQPLMPPAASLGCHDAASSGRSIHHSVNSAARPSSPNRITHKFAYRLPLV